jgi:sugar O-acyltransferase (sialic acid O-acetyltransferase NeuD family)
VNKNKIILVGAGGHAKSCIDVIEKENKYSIAGLIGKKSEVGLVKNGIKVIGSDEDIPGLAQEFEFALITVGQIENYSLRTALYEIVCQSGMKLPTIISPTAHIASSVRIGQGTIVMHGSIINTSVNIGSNCIINSGAIIEHDSEIGNNTHISTGVIINGEVKIGDETFIGSGSVIRNGVNIGNRVFIKMGSRVIDDVRLF